MQEATTFSIFYDGTSFQHLAAVLISVFTLCYGPGLLFRGPLCIRQDKPLTPLGHSLTTPPSVLLDCIVCPIWWTVLCALVCFQNVCMQGPRKYTISQYKRFLSWMPYKVPSECNWNFSTLNMDILMSFETLVFIHNITRRSSDTILMIFSPIITSNLAIEILHRLDNVLNRKCDNVADIM